MLRTRLSIANVRPVLAATLAIVAAGSLSGCTQARNWLEMRGNEAEKDPVILGAPEAEEYLRDLADIASGDPARQAEIFADSRAAAQLTPNPSTSLRYALVLAAPGHPESNPQEAQSLLRELLTQAPLMTQAEVSLATIHLSAVEQLMVLESETRRLRANSSRAQQTQEQAINQRLATVEAENRRLRDELSDAEQKLEAITTIERSIREQE